MISRGDFNFFIDNCNLCLSEKTFIIRNLDDVNMLNKRSEFISKCRHISKQLSNRVKDDINDWQSQSCVFVLLYVFLYYLSNLFVFVGKNIDWRLPSMKLVVSIMLPWIPSQLTHIIYIYILIIIYIYI